MPDVIIIGGGVIGMGIAWRAADAGLDVGLIDPDPGKGASWVAAGMIAPITEAHPGEERTLGLALESAHRFPEWVAELEAATGLDVGFRSSGTLVVAADAGDKAYIDHLAAFQRRLGLTVETLSSRACRGHEPLLAPGVRGGALVDDDHSVENRCFHAALTAAAAGAGTHIERTTVVVIETEAGRVTGVRLADGTHLETAAVVLAAGCWSASIGGLPPSAVPPVRPVKGQILRLRTTTGEPFIRRPVRAVVAGRSVYIVPRADGEVVIGATVEEQGWDTTVTAEAVHELLHDATTVLPSVGDLELVEASAGLRPGTPDNVPIIGPTDVGGLFIASGHYRNGILLTPITADLVVAHLKTALS